MVKNVSALDAYREGGSPLPPGYTIEYGADVLLLRREGGSVVAAFSARGATPKGGEADRLGRPQAERRHGLTPPAFDAGENFAPTIVGSTATGGFPRLAVAALLLRRSLPHAEEGP